MAQDIKFAVLNQKETLRESIYKDIVTFSLLAFCIHISQGSTWWTFVTGLMFLFFLYTKLHIIVIERTLKFKTKAELQTWVDSLADDEEV